MSDKIFDDILSRAFYKYNEKVIASYPSDEEMRKMYPISQKYVKIYEKMAQVRKPQARKGSKVLKVILVACLIVVLLSATIIAISEPVRERIKYSITQNNDSINYVGENDSTFDEPDYSSYTVGYIPEYFELFDDNIMCTQREIIYYHEDNSGNYINIGIFNFETSTIGISPDYSYHTVKMIGGREAHIYYYDAHCFGNIIMLEDNVLINIIGYCSLEELVKIAENIK